MVDFAILTVCSGNVCRSPMAEQLLRAGLSRWPTITVTSSGTTALLGEQMPDEAASLSRHFGGDPSLHFGRQLVEAPIRQSGLVFGMAREHRRAVVQLVPQASRYTFTLREFARLAGEVSDGDFEELALLSANDVTARLRAAVEFAASYRGLEPPESPEDDDIVDPYRGSDELYELSAGQLVPAVEATVSFLTRAATVAAR